MATETVAHKSASDILKTVEQTLFGDFEALVVRTISDAAKNSLATRLELLKEELVSREKETLEQIKLAKVELQIAQVKFEAMRAKVEKQAANPSEIVYLNVGGQVFASKRETFMRDPDSFFYHLLGSDWVKADDGTIFIDRDPTLFPYIMNYLRSGRWNIHHLSLSQYDRLEEELEFYTLKLELEWQFLDPRKAYNSIVLTNENQTSTGSGTVLSRDFLTSHAVWDVTIDVKSGNSWTGIGIALAQTDLSSLCTDTAYGCGLYIDQGNCYFRSKGNNVEELNAIIGPATVGKVIRVTYDRTELKSTIKFEVEGRSTQEYVVNLDGKVYLAMSPASDCTMTITRIEQ